mmetsp:Transcript_73646/g.204747  ORF Transcript_73646/g.204747 Transcript_73646/m.204747 type:complete len:203 (-) Transcript_73646:311-919(-)
MLERLVWHNRDHSPLMERAESRRTVDEIRSSSMDPRQRLCEGVARLVGIGPREVQGCRNAPPLEGDQHILRAVAKGLHLASYSGHRYSILDGDSWHRGVDRQRSGHGFHTQHRRAYLRHFDIACNAPDVVSLGALSAVRCGGRGERDREGVLRQASSGQGVPHIWPVSFVERHAVPVDRHGGLHVLLPHKVLSGELHSYRGR